MTPTKNQSSNSHKHIVLSGIRATGRLHLGNYFGAVKGMLELQNNPDYETNYMVADFHAITTPYDPKQLIKDKREVIIDYLACGLDPEKSTIFIQSMVPEHLELAFYFSSAITVARSLHLPTYKEKIRQYPDSATMALLNYPVLMAADILIYKADFVPVGIDQEPHIEYARQIARNMNEMYHTNFPEPLSLETETRYIPSLLNEGKMSKSVSGSYISLTDSLEEIRQKIARMPTDSGMNFEIPEGSPISNFLKFIELFLGIERRRQVETDYLSIGIRYAELKEELSNAIYAFVKPIQQKRLELVHNTIFVDYVIESGAARSREKASKTLVEVREKMGF